MTMAEKKKSTKKKTAKKSKQTRALQTRGKRKRAIARATIKEGANGVTVNGYSLNAMEDPYYREIVSEPLAFVGEDFAAKHDVSVTVKGGGKMGQAQAVRTAIARAIINFTGDEETKKKMLEWDRSLLVEDSRRVEPKKFLGPKARARFTKSYR
jgi:small subunit ribosomal protein S9